LIGVGAILAGRYVPVGAPPLEAIRYAWSGDPSGYYDSEGRSIKKFFLKSPLNYRRISSHFTHSRLHPILKVARPHLGVDYAAPEGTPVVALGGGRVVSVSWKKGFGRTVVIKHNAAYLSQYAHLSRYASGLHAGARVNQGQVIGYVGSTGHATGPHLDFRVQESGRWIDPLRLKGGESLPLPQNEQGAFRELAGRWARSLESLGSGESIPLEDEGDTTPQVASGLLDTPPTS
jgi:murein DD-endopeptidase MepM/ murein hydrolase activator NlpD